MCSIVYLRERGSVYGAFSSLSVRLGDQIGECSSMLDKVQPDEADVLIHPLDRENTT